MQVKDILNSIKRLNNKSDKTVTLYTNKWYRIAVAEITTSIPTACILKVGTGYGNQAPMTDILAIVTSHTTGNIEELAKRLHSTSKHIDKVRIQIKENPRTFYIDVHYNLSNLTNNLYLNFLGKDNYWKFTDSNEVTEYETVAEISL